MRERRRGRALDRRNELRAQRSRSVAIRVGNDAFTVSSLGRTIWVPPVGRTAQWKGGRRLQSSSDGYAAEWAMAMKGMTCPNCSAPQSWQVVRFGVTFPCPACGQLLPARIVVDGAGLPPEFRPGASFPYFYGYFEPRVLDMILDTSRRWVRVKYEPTDSIRIVADEGALYGEFEAGGPIPSGFHILARIPRGWSKENCEFCQERIGAAGQPFGYRDPRDVAAGVNSSGPWLCERDYEQFASRHDLGFLLT